MQLISEYLLYLYLFSIPFDSILLGNLMSFPKIIAILLSFSYAIETILNLKNAKFEIGELIYLLILLLYIILKVLFSVSFEMSLNRFYVFVQLLFVTFISVSIISKKIDIFKNAIYAYLAGAIIIYFISIYKIIINGYNFARLNAFGTPGEEAHYGIILSIAFIIIVVLLKDKNNLLLKIFLLTNLILGIILSQTRSSWLAVTFIIIIDILLFNKSKNRFIFIIMIALVIFALINFINTNYSFKIVELINSRILNAIETGGAGRVEIWDTALPLIKEKPIFGFGFDTFSYVYNYQYIKDVVLPRGEHRAAHNIYLTIIIENGIMGLIIFLSGIFILIKNNLKIKHAKNSQYFQIALYTLLGVLIIGFFIDILYRKYFWFVISLSLSMMKLKNSNYYRCD